MLSIEDILNGVPEKTKDNKNKSTYIETPFIESLYCAGTRTWVCNNCGAVENTFEGFFLLSIKHSLSAGQVEEKKATQKLIGRKIEKIIHSESRVANCFSCFNLVQDNNFS